MVDSGENWRKLAYMAADWMALADLLRAEMARRGWHQRDLAAAAGVGLRTVNRLINGKLKDLPHTIASIELAVDWLPGTARRVVYEGFRPAEQGLDRAPSRPILRNDDEREIWEIGERRGWPEEERWVYIKVYRDRRADQERKRHHG